MESKAYFWSEPDGGEMHGIFDSVEAAIADAREDAESWGNPFVVHIFDGRPATEDDRYYFEGEDPETGETIDFAPNWFEGRWVPENVVEKLFIG